MSETSTQSNRVAHRWTLENHVNNWVKSEFERLDLQNQVDYNEESAFSDYLKQALKGSAKTQTKTSFGKPDFSIEKYAEIKLENFPVVIIENKLSLKKLVIKTGNQLKMDDASISDYAVNGAIYYAQSMIASEKYNEVIAIGIAGESEQNVKVEVYYVYGNSGDTYKYLDSYQKLDFLENQKSFNNFYQSVLLTEEEKHQILIDSRKKLQKYAKELNKLMHNHAITAPQRVLYVSGMLLSMQDLHDEDGSLKKPGLTPNDLKGLIGVSGRDGEKIDQQIVDYLNQKNILQDKVRLMSSSFNEIQKDQDRDNPIELDKLVSKLLDKRASINKQIFTYIYEYIFKSIDSMSGHIDIMGEMYSEFLKYALGDGKEIGIVLTPPYVTKMMSRILEIDIDSKVMDLATGSAGFLISAMELMISEANNKYGMGTTKANGKISEIKENQLLGVELNAEMFTLASTNMILRGDGSSNIQKGSSFDRPENLYSNFNANKLLLNPPFTFEENGMPFIRFGLEHMQIGGKAAIIIQDSAGSGKAIRSNQEILKNNQLLASIKMPMDLFVPMAGVQTSIYIIEHTAKPHDKENKFVLLTFAMMDISEPKEVLKK